MPEGCKESVRRRLRDEWGIVGRVWRGRRTEPELARAMVSQHGSHAALHVLSSKQGAKMKQCKVNDEVSDGTDVDEFR